MDAGFVRGSMKVWRCRETERQRDRETGEGERHKTARKAGRTDNPDEKKRRRRRGEGEESGKYQTEL